MQFKLEINARDTSVRPHCTLACNGVCRIPGLISLFVREAALFEFWLSDSDDDEAASSAATDGSGSRRSAFTSQPLKK